MKPKQLPRLWCALQGLLPLERRGVSGEVEPKPARWGQRDSQPPVERKPRRRRA